MLNGAESQIARTPKFEFIINPCPTECRAVADGDRTAERIISFCCQSSTAYFVELRKLKLLNAEIIVFLSRPSIFNRFYEVCREEFSFVSCLFLYIHKYLYTISRQESLQAFIQKIKIS